jgi:light-harvesting protein B-800-850 alpha chain
MTNSKMWLVVNPTVGIPLLLGGVVVAALSVHTALLFNTTWFPAFLQGTRPARTSELPAQPNVAQVTMSGEVARAPGVALVKVSLPAK